MNDLEKSDMLIDALLSEARSEKWSDKKQTASIQPYRATSDGRDTHVGFNAGDAQWVYDNARKRNDKRSVAVALAALELGIGSHSWRKCEQIMKTKYPRNWSRDAAREAQMGMR